MQDTLRIRRARQAAIKCRERRRAHGRARLALLDSCTISAAALRAYHGNGAEIEGGNPRTRCPNAVFPNLDQRDDGVRRVIFYPHTVLRE